MKYVAIYSQRRQAVDITTKVFNPPYIASTFISFKSGYVVWVMKCLKEDWHTCSVALIIEGFIHTV